MTEAKYESPTIIFGEEGVPTPQCVAVGFVVFVAVSAVIWNAAVGINWVGVTVAAGAVAAAAVVVGVGVDC